jgi:hypothetical protein
VLHFTRYPHKHNLILPCLIDPYIHSNRELTNAFRQALAQHRLRIQLTDGAIQLTDGTNLLRDPTCKDLKDVW